MIYLLAALNVFVGVFNMFPLLPLDGGHAAIATYERVRERPTRRALLRRRLEDDAVRPGRHHAAALPVHVGPLSRRHQAARLSRGRWSSRRDARRSTSARCRRWRRADLGAVDDDHQDGRRRRHVAADLRARRRRLRHRSLHVQRDRGGRRARPDRAPLAGADHRRHPPPVQDGARRPGGRGAGPAAQPGQHPPARAHQGRRRRGTRPRRADPHRRQRRLARPGALREATAASRPRRWSSRRCRSWRTSTRSTSTSSRSR